MPGSMFDYPSDAPDETFSQYKARMARIEAEQRADLARQEQLAVRQAALDQVTPQDAPPVACVDCKFYKVAGDSPMDSRCRHSLAQERVGNIVAGFRMVWPRCETVRLNPEQCGPGGQWWVKVNPIRRFFR
jgi:hypothetical protein